jgi:hypothetical protein
MEIKQGKRRVRHSFALAEVCVALVIIGICISYVFSSVQHTIQRYTSLHQEIVCHELADEHLAQLIATFLTAQLEYETIVEGSEDSLIDGIYEIELSTSVEESDDSENQESVAKKKASLVTLTVTVHPIGKEDIYAIRITRLCIGQEGSI